MAKNNGGFLLGAIIGGVVGAATAVLLTSERGKKLLEDMNQTENLEQIKTTAAEWLEIAKEKAKEVGQFVPIGKKDESAYSSRSFTNDTDLKSEKDDKSASPSESALSEVTSIPIPIQSKEDSKENIEILLKEAEAAFNDAEKKLQKPNEEE